MIRFDSIRFDLPVNLLTQILQCLVKSLSTGGLIFKEDGAVECALIRNILMAAAENLKRTAQLGAPLLKTF